jgi:hypothetical protein
VLGFGQINPTQQQRKLFVTQYDLALRIAGLRPGETSFLQPLGTDPESATIPDEDLQPIALGIAEQEEVPAQRLARQSIPDQTVQPFEPLAHVGDSSGQIDACGWTQSADRPHLEIQDPGTVWISPSGKVFVFVVDTKTNAPLWVEV